MDLIFFDIDGTIDDELGRVPESAARAIRRAMERGAVCSINSGRPYSHIVPQVREIGFTAFVCSIGQHIVLDGNCVQRLRPTAEQARRVAAFARDCRLDAYYESEEGLCLDVCHPIGGGMLRQLAEFEKRGLSVLRSLPENGYHFDKFCVWEKEDSSPQAFFNAVSSLFYPIHRGGGMTEMVLCGCTKATGMARLKRELSLRHGVDESSIATYAIGDSPNDETMLRAADHPIVMGGSDPKVASLAEFVTDTLWNDGLYKALDHYGLI